MRPTASVISKSAPGVAIDSSPRRRRAAAVCDDACARKSAASAPSADAPAATSCTCCRNSPRATCKPRSASNLMPCSTLEKISATATTETAMTGPSAATMSATDSRRRSPRRCIGNDVGKAHADAPRPNHSGGR